MRLTDFVDFTYDTLNSSDCVDPGISIHKGVSPYLCLTETPKDITVWVMASDYVYNLENRRAVRHNLRWQPVVAVLVAKKLVQVSSLPDIANYEETVPIIETAHQCSEVLAATPQVAELEVRTAIQVPLELRVHASMIQIFFKDSKCLPSNNSCESSS
jgi:hypothetical protein